MKYEHLVYLGDFNIHVNNSTDPEVEQFLDMMHMVGLDQHIKFDTHKLGNTLDLVFA